MSDICKLSPFALSLAPANRSSQDGSLQSRSATIRPYHYRDANDVRCCNRGRRRTDPTPAATSNTFGQNAGAATNDPSLLAIFMLALFK